MTYIDITAEYNQLVETALWSSLVTDAEGETVEADSIEDVDYDTFAPLRSMLEDFIEANREDCERWTELHGSGQIGHDLWLTAQGHGAGFFDRYAMLENLSLRDEVETIGDRLTKAASKSPIAHSYLYFDGEPVRLA
jgi:hypothetical protein